MESPKKAWVTGIDQIWLINLARRRDRLDRFLQAQPEMNGRINFLPAYDGKNLKLTPALARLFAPNNFDWHKPTMGCALSHLSLWQRLAVEPNPLASYLILEDDARLEPSWVRKVEETFLSGSVPADWEVLYLGGILPQYRESFERNVQPVNQLVARVYPDCRFGNNPSGYFHFCAYSYILSQRGARRLLDLLHFWNGYWLQADFVAAYHTPDLSPPRRIYFFHPLIAESFQDTAQGLARPYDENQGQENKVDSDIWKNDDRFGPDEISAIKTDGLPLDIPAALGWAPDEPLSVQVVALQEAPQKLTEAYQSKIKPSSSKIQGIDKICLINLERRKDRLEKFLINNRDIADQVFILKAYDGKKLALTPRIARLFAPNDFAWNKATMGCSLSHLELWHKLANESDEVNAYLILEDDTKLSPGWQEIVQKAFQKNQLPENWDVLYLGGVIPKYYDQFERHIEPLNMRIARIKVNASYGQNPPNRYHHFGAFAYILSKHGAKQMLEFVKQVNGLWSPADILLGYITPEGYPIQRYLYFTNPLQAVCYQDIEVNYARSYEEPTESAIVDSDIWQIGASFSEAEVAATLNPKDILDIPNALADARRDQKPNEGESCDPSVDLGDARKQIESTEGELRINQKLNGFMNLNRSVKKAGLICVTRNSADKLKVTLESIVRHTDPALFDLYVVDNGSTDSTVELCEGTWPPNIHFIRKNENLGWVGGINSCLPEAKKHSFVGLLNDDIEVGPRWLEHLVNLIEWNKTVGAVGPLTSNDRDWQGYDRFRLGPAKPGLPELEGIDRQDVVQMATATASFNPGVTLNDCVLAFFCILIRTEIVEKIGLLDEVFNELYLGDDDDYCKRILATGQLLALSFNAYVAHHSGSRSLAVKDYESRYQKAQQIISEKTAKGAYARKQLANKSASIPHLAAEGDLVPQNLGHMVCEGHLGGFFSEGDGGTYYPLMWAHLVRKHGIRSVLDVGCGRGYSALYFKSLGCHIKGIDGSQEAQATNLLGEDFVLADYAVAPSSIQTEFDLVWSCEFVEHVEERFMKNYLRDFRRGRFLAMTFAGPGQPGHHHVNCRPAEYWIRVMYSQGFDYLPEETAELREYAKKDMEKNDSESDKRFVYHFMYRGLFFKNTGTCSGGL